MALATALAVAGIAAAGAYSSSQAQKAARREGEALDYGAITRDTLQAQIDLAPDLYRSEAEFRPKYNALDLEELEATLMGRPAGKRGETYTDYELQEQVVGSEKWQHPVLGHWMTRPVMGQVPVPVNRTREVDTPAQKGLLELLETEIGPGLHRLRRADAAADVETVRELGPKSREAMRLFNPETAGLVDRLATQADANMRGEFDPGEQRLAQQAIRQAQASRGVGYGPNDTWEEVYGVTGQGTELARMRALEAIGANQSFYGDPFMQILQRSSSTSPGAAAVLGSGAAMNAGAGPRLFNPESPFAGDVAMTNFNAQEAARISAGNNQAAMLGAGIGALGMLGGGYLAGR